MKILYFNVQGVMNNFIELERIITNSDVDVICLTETHFTEDDNDDLIQINDFYMIKVNSHTRHTGGVIIYVRKNCSYKIVSCDSIRNEFWLLHVKISSGNNLINVICLYRSPRYVNVNDNFLIDINNYFENWSDMNEKCIVMGDFNINWNNNDSVKLKMQDIFQYNLFKQIVNDYTRITETSKTLIDWVVSNFHENIEISIDDDAKLSDHETLYVNVCLDKNLKHYNKTTKVRKIIKYNKNRFRARICGNDIMTTYYYIDCNLKAEKFSSNLHKIVNEFVVQKNFNVTDNVWFNNELAILKQNKKTQYTIAKWINNNEEWNKYTSLRNKYKNKINLTKNNFIKQKINNSYNQKSMWCNIKKYVMNKKDFEINNINFGGEIVEEKLYIAEKFNSYFIDSINKINNEIPKIEYNNIIQPTPHIFKFRKITMNELHSILKNMNNKKDHYFVNANMFIDSFDLIGSNLLSIINNSLESGVFPNFWKDSIVVPVEKIKGSNKCEDFRPINTISTESKIIEKIVNIQLEDYLNKFSLIYENQSGFRKHHSCESLINLIVTNWKMAIHDKKVIIAIFLDLQRAFETVDQGLLIEKLKSYGVYGTELKWFKSYITGRKQRTKIKDSISSSIDVKLGVPQGSILGVLLFIIYINDMVKSVEFSKLVLFADDALLYVCGDNITECVTKINHDLEKLNVWFKMNKLNLNLKKTKCMFFNDNASTNINIDNKIIEKVNDIKYLGIMIDNKLDFKCHVQYICKKIAKKIYFFSKIRPRISLNTAIKIYNTMIKPHFEYCSSILFLSTREMLGKLQKLQNKSMRIVLQVGRHSSIIGMLETLKWMSVYQRILVNVFVIVFKLKQNIYPSYLCNRLIYSGDVHNYNLRNIFNFRLNFFRNEKTKNMLLYKGLNLFNNLPNELKIVNNLNEFKRKIVIYVKNNFEPV